MLNAEHYDNPDVIEMITVDELVRICAKYTLFFQVGDAIYFYEAQNSIGPNLPFRFELYFGLVYSKYITKHNLDLDSPVPVRFPAPQFICFHEGEQETEDITIVDRNTVLLNADDEKAGLENATKVLAVNKSKIVRKGVLARFDENHQKCDGATVVMLNINRGHNEDLLKACRPLGEYSELLRNIRNFHDEARKRSGKQGSFEKEEEYAMLGEAVRKAVEKMPEDALLKGFLVQELEKVIDICIDTYNDFPTSL
ncbi:MAG: hypothetical protein IJ523_02765 [Succinivibrionaceae bacterium]|nr:hypothetical protein [Succinivibrionaceae bacterium]